tara:strand:- start:1295 stop:1651 length:357 start_codon:yes stop_codon:yes gene_type:complete
MSEKFALTRKNIKLVFDDVEDELHTFEIEARLDIELGTFLLFQEKLADSDDNMTGMKEAFTLWADEVLLGWNLTTEEGEPIPATVEGFMKLSPSVASRVIALWSQNVSQIDPLAEGES